MRDRSDRTRGGGNGQRREGRRNDAGNSSMATWCSRSRFSSMTSRGPYDTRWDCEVEHSGCVATGRMRSSGVGEDEYETADTAD